MPKLSKDSPLYWTILETIALNAPEGATHYLDDDTMDGGYYREEPNRAYDAGGPLEGSVAYVWDAHYLTWTLHGPNVPKDSHDLRARRPAESPAMPTLNLYNTEGLEWQDQTEAFRNALGPRLRKDVDRLRIRERGRTEWRPFYSDPRDPLRDLSSTYNLDGMVVRLRPPAEKVTPSPSVEGLQDRIAELESEAEILRTRLAYFKGYAVGRGHTGEENGPTMEELTKEVSLLREDRVRLKTLAFGQGLVERGEG